MELLSFQTAALLLIAVLAVKLFPKRAADFVLAAETLYVLYENNTTFYFIVTLLILAAVYLGGRLLEALGEKKARVLTYLMVAALALGLCIWKYRNFFIGNINFVARHLTGREPLALAEVSAPFGISYLFLILISYILGIYWRVMKARSNPMEYLHLIAFFPICFMGPILGMEDMKESERLEVSYHSLTFGLQRICWGVFQKLVISERCAVVVNTIYAQPEVYGGFYVVLAALLFVLQLYTEFAGAMDIVCGAAEMIGKKLPENFDRPFAAVTIAEFWRRWHITLGAWLRNFVLYPLLRTRLFLWMGEKLKKKFGKKRGRNLVTYMGLLVSWFLIGLWHGGGWNYIFGSGIFMWFLIVGSEVLQPVFQKITGALRINKDCWSYQSFAKIRTMLLFAFGNIFFRAGTFSAAITLLKAMVRNFNPWIFADGSLLALGLDAKDWNVCVAAVLLLFLVSQIKKRCDVRDWLASQNLVFRWGVIYGLLAVILLFGCYGSGYDAASFIYQGF
ncbi:MAG: hypothetical protein LUE24_05055 [Lachnospiraceae bacterium]|nr:hypothetical protein [Lachnospiraceae bacterium]